MQRLKKCECIMRDNKKSLSMFSKETLDSLEMAEVFGGDENSVCRNEKCSNKENCTDSPCSNNSCSNVCTVVAKDSKNSTQIKDADNYTDTSCVYNSVCSCSEKDSTITPTNTIFCLEADEE